MIAFIAVLSVASDGESINFTKDFFFSFSGSLWNQKKPLDVYSLKSEIVSWMLLSNQI